VLESDLYGCRAIVAHHLVGKETHQPVERSDVAGEEKSEFERCRKNPLANRHGGKDALDEMRGGVAHAPRIAGGANAALLAAEGNDQLLATGLALGSQESVAQDAAAQVGAKLRLHVSWQWLAVPLARLR
jgi:hypothetical protein